MTALGPLGMKLKMFASLVDFTHPDVCSIFEGQLTNDADGSFGKIALDLLRLSARRKEFDLSDSVLQKLSNVVMKNWYYRRIERAIDDCLRFLPEAERKRQREKKVCQPISLHLVYKRDPLFWSNLNGDFSRYIRFSNLHQEEHDKYTRQHNVFAKAGLIGMSSRMSQMAERVKNYRQHYGFNPVSLTEMAVSLAKNIGFDFVDRRLVYKNEDMDYAPLAFTMEDLYPYASDSIKQLLHHLDHFPEAGEHPIFDYFRVVVASIDGHVSLEEQKMVALTFLQKKATPGVLVGEKDGQMYFVSYWL